MKRRKTIRIERSAKTGRFTTVKRARRYKSTHVVVRIRRACYILNFGMLEFSFFVDLFK